VQQLLSEQIRIAEHAFEDNEEPRDFAIEDSQGDYIPSICDCRFFRKWQLPCQHIWHHYLVYGSLTETTMETWKWMWEKGGYELYKTREAKWVEKGILQEIGVPL
jgi:hypothetical protein